MTKKYTITREQIERYNAMIEALRGADNYNLFYTMHEYLNGTRWVFIGWGGIRSSYLEHKGEEFYIKCVKGNYYIYWEYLTEKERFLLANDVSKAFFGIKC